MKNKQERAFIPYWRKPVFALGVWLALGGPLNSGINAEINSRVAEEQRVQIEKSCYVGASYNESLKNEFAPANKKFNEGYIQGMEK